MSGASRAPMKSAGVDALAPRQCSAALSMTAESDVSICVMAGTEASDMESGMNWLL